MAKPMTALDDQLAALLRDLGYSFKAIGRVLERSDKTAKDGAARGKKPGQQRWTADQERRAHELLGFQTWIKTGRDKGYLNSLAVFLEPSQGSDLKKIDAATK